MWSGVACVRLLHMALCCAHRLPIDPSRISERAVKDPSLMLLYGPADCDDLLSSPTVKASLQVEGFNYAQGELWLPSSNARTPLVR